MTNVVPKLLFFPKFNIYNQQVRFYPRWNHRKPVKVYNPEEYEELEKKVSQKNGPINKVEKPTTVEPQYQSSTFGKYEGNKIKWKHAEHASPVKFKIKPQKPLSANKQKSKVAATDMLETVIDSEGKFVYTKMKNNDPRIGTILTEVKSKSAKTKKSTMLLEGKRLIKEALQSNCQLKYILFSQKSDVEDLVPYLPKFGAHLYKMPYNEMQMWSDLTTNPGVMGIFQIPDSGSFKPASSIPLTLICDNIREPGNLGAILRICAGVGCAKVLLTKGCTNLWDTKVLRSSMGAQFKLKICTNVAFDEIESEIVADTETALFLADNRVVSPDTDNVNNSTPNRLPLLPYFGVNFWDNKNVALIIGGETQGISQESYDLVAKLNGAIVNIPLSNQVESLNVGAALGVIAFEIKRQLLSLN